MDLGAQRPDLGALRQELGALGVDLGARRADLGALGQDLDVLFALLWVWIWVWASGTLAGVVQFKTVPSPPTHHPPPSERI